MPLDYQRLRDWVFPEIRQSYAERDAILYALGLGIGEDPLDPDQLRYVYEANIRMFPTMPVVLAAPGFWLQNPATGVDWKKIVATSQDIEVLGTFPASGTVTSRMRVTEIYDKGADKGALLTYARDLFDAGTGEHLATVSGSSFLRGDGGFGGSAASPPTPPPLPARAPDHAIDIPTLPQAALIYRLSGDYNPLHADPAVAAAAGFSRPILHGFCTFGIAARAVLKALGNIDPGNLRQFGLRFSAPVIPGETIRTQIWDEGGGQLRFLCRVAERDQVVANFGTARVHHEPATDLKLTAEI